MVTRQTSFSSWYIFTIDKFDDNVNSFYKDPFVALENDSNTWIQNNPYVEILEPALKIMK